MLKLKDKRPTKVPQDVTFDQPTTVQKQGVDMLIALNLTAREAVTGPDFGLDAKILVTKEKPHFFFNPVLNSVEDDSTLNISYQNYLGSEKTIALNDPTGEIRKEIDYLHNGAKRKRKPKV